MNNFFGHLIKEIGVTRYDNDKQLVPTFSLYETYQYSESMMKHLTKDSPQKLEKTVLSSEKPIYFNKTTIDRRINKESGGGNATSKANDAKELNIDERIKQFGNQLKINFSIGYP